MQILLNNIFTKLAAAVGTADTTINVTAGDGVKFALATGGNTIRATLVKISGFKEIAWEIVDITARATDALTVTRAREGTTALTFAIGDLVDVRFTASTPALLAGSASQSFSMLNGTVAGTLSVGTATPLANNKVTISNGGGNETIAFDGGGTTNSWSLGSGKGVANGTFTLYDNTAAGNRITVLPTSGNVGIGITAPAYKLEVAGTLGVTGASSTLGYGVGSGGTVTQATSRTTGVTLDKATGAITLFSTTTTAATFASFTLTNARIAAADVVIVNFASATSADSYGVCVTAVAAGSCRIQIHNIVAVGTAEAPVVNFTIIKGSAS